MGNYNGDCVFSLQKDWGIQQLKSLETSAVFGILVISKDSYNILLGAPKLTVFCYIFFIVFCLFVVLFLFLFLIESAFSFTLFSLFFLFTVSKDSQLPSSNLRFLTQKSLLGFTNFSYHLPHWFTCQVTFCPVLPVSYPRYFQK